MKSLAIHWCITNCRWQDSDTVEVMSSVGCIARILSDVEEDPSDTLKVKTVGQQRFRVVSMRRQLDGWVDWWDADKISGSDWILMVLYCCVYRRMCKAPVWCLSTPSWKSHMGEWKMGKWVHCFCGRESPVFCWACISVLEPEHLLVISILCLTCRLRTNSSVIIGIAQPA